MNLHETVLCCATESHQGFRDNDTEKIKMTIRVDWLRKHLVATSGLTLSKNILDSSSDHTKL